MGVANSTHTGVFLKTQGVCRSKSPSSGHISVACAVIEQNGLVLAAQRSELMSMPLKWEFPGGKIHEGESPEECLLREIKEELDVIIAIKGALSPVTWEYADFTVTLHPFICEIMDGRITLHEHSAIKWLRLDELCSLDWPEADMPVIEEYLTKARDKDR